MVLVLLGWKIGLRFLRQLLSVEMQTKQKRIAFNTEVNTVLALFNLKHLSSYNPNQVLPFLFHFLHDLVKDDVIKYSAPQETQL